MEDVRKNTIILSSVIVVLFLLGKRAFAAEVPGLEKEAEAKALQVLDESEMGAIPPGVIIADTESIVDKKEPIYLNLSSYEVWVPQQISDDIQLVRENGLMTLKRV